MTTHSSPMHQQRAGNTDEDIDADNRNDDVVKSQDSKHECSLEDADRPGLDEVFELLKNPRRRQVLVYLHSRDDTASVGHLADQIGGWENDKEPRLLTSKERKRVYVSLYQSHLPKMADTGAISYNKDRGVVEAGPYIHSFIEYLPEIEEPTDSIVDRIYRGIRHSQDIF
jgi:hypothetical protein